MIYLFFGPDNFSIQAEINLITEKAKAPVEYIDGGDFEATFLKLLETDLFSKSKVFVLKNIIDKLDLDKQLKKLTESPLTLIFWENKLDKRTKQTKDLLKNKTIKAVEFIAPSGAALKAWVISQVKNFQGDIEQTAAEFLASSQGTKDRSDTDLNQLYNEIKKLLAYSAGKTITTEMVKNLVTKNYETEIWDIINAVAEKRTSEVFKGLQGFFNLADSSDEKAKVIQLNALLADQFRNILLVKSFTSQNIPETEILQQTGWKPGRLFIMKKLAKNFQAEKILAILTKLEHLDLELKTTNTPARVTLELIAVQMV